MSQPFISSADLARYRAAALRPMTTPCTVDGTSTVCILRQTGNYTPAGLPAWVVMDRAEIDVPWNTVVAPGSIVVVTGMGTWRAEAVTVPRTVQTYARISAIALPDGTGAIPGSNAVVTFVDTSSGETIEDAPVLLFPAAQAVEITPEAVNFEYAIAWSPDLTYPTKGTPDIGDRVDGFYRLPNGGYLTKPYPTLSPVFPMLLAFIRESM